MKVGLGIGVVALALLVCAAALAQTPTPDPPPVPQPPPPTQPPPPPSEPSAPPPPETPSTAPVHHPRKHARMHREHAKERQLVQQELGPFHPSTAEAGPMVLVPEAALVNTRQVLSAISAGSIAHTDGPRPVVIALAIVLVFMSGIVLLVFLQY